MFGVEPFLQFEVSILHERALKVSTYGPATETTDGIFVCIFRSISQKDICFLKLPVRGVRIVGSHFFGYGILRWDC